MRHWRGPSSSTLDRSPRGHQRSERAPRTDREAERHHWRRLERRFVAALTFSALALIGASSWLARRDSSEEQGSGLIAALRDANSDVRALAAYRASRQPAPDSTIIRELARLLADSAEDARREAVNALIALGSAGNAVRPTVIKALITVFYGGQQDATQVNAAHVLGAIGPTAKSAIPALVRALESANADLRGAAASALGDIDTPDATVLRNITATTRDAAAGVRATAVEALAKLRPDSTTALVAALMARSDSVMYVRLAAVYALDATNRYSSAGT